MDRQQTYLKENFNKLKEKEVVIIGLGGTGSTVAQLISKYPLKKLTLIDRDVVEETNLSRQIIYKKEDCEQPKAFAAKNNIESNCSIEAVMKDISPKTIIELFKSNPDLIIECTDNTETRLIINDYCHKNNIPWVSCSGVGQLASVQFINNNTPCFNCTNKTKYGQTCSEVGVLNSTVSLIGSWAVNLAINYLTKDQIENEIIHLNLETNTVTKLKPKKDPNCKTCNKEYPYLNQKQTKKICQLCSTRFQFEHDKPFDMTIIEKRLQSYGKVEGTEEYLYTPGIIVFPEGRIIIRAQSETDARKKYDEIIGI